MMPTRTVLRGIIRGPHRCRYIRGHASEVYRSTKQLNNQDMVSGSCIKVFMVPQRNMATASRDSSTMDQAMEFLETFYASQEHGILSIEAACGKFCQCYRKLEESEKKTLLLYLARNYGANQELIVQVSQQIVSSQERGEAVLLRTEERMRNALIPRFQILFSQIGRIEGGVKHLVDMRADILNMQTTSTCDLDLAYLRTLQNSLRDLLSLWFTVGFLSLERITWESPCDMVQKISEYEAVHPIRNWADLKRRVGPNRRCFVFTHSSMPREPVVVLHTALTNQISSCIHSIIGNPAYSSPTGSPVSSTSSTSTVSKEEQSIIGNPAYSSPTGSPVSSTSSTSVLSKEEQVEDPTQINTAMFYSITSTQKGLQGVDLGNYLIKKVVSELQQELPNVTQFSSISPIPGFREWLIGEINRHLHAKQIGEEITDPILIDTEMTDLQYCAKNDSEDPLDAFKTMVNDHGWSNNEHYSDVVKVPLLRLCARYLYVEKRRGYALNPVATFKTMVNDHGWSNNEHYSDVVKAPLLRLCARYLYVEKRWGYALNPVANFHLQNGAVLWRLNWMGDMTLRGLNKSCGIMVNYRYYLEYTEYNSQQYIENQVINADQQVKELLEQK